MRLERSRTDVKLFGLCGGIARQSGIGSGWIRFGLIAGTFFTGGTLFILYMIASMVVPKEPEYSSCSGGYWYMPTPQAYAFGGTPSTSSGLDSMMHGMEERAMRRELQELRTKLARYELEV